MCVCIYMPLVGGAEGSRMSQIVVGLQMNGTRSWGGWLRAPRCLGADVGLQVGKLGPDMARHGAVVVLIWHLPIEGQGWGPGLPELVSSQWWVWQQGLGVLEVVCQLTGVQAGS